MAGWGGVTILAVLRGEAALLPQAAGRPRHAPPPAARGGGGEPLRLRHVRVLRQGEVGPANCVQSLYVWPGLGSLQ